MSKTIFITGSSTGLGHATARLFAERGWKVIATLRKPDSDEGKALAAIAGVTVLPLDVTQPAQIEAAAAKALALGPVDVVFNNAGYGLAGPLEGMTDAQLVAQIDTNLLGVIRTTKAFVPAFRERGAGVFIATTSIGGLVTFPFNSAYHATKWALEGWSESLAYELGEFGIQVKTVAPGGISTDFAGRSLVLAQHPAYAAQIAKVFAAFMDPARRAESSTAAQIAEVVWEAATDGKDQVSYVAGADAKAMFAQRLAGGIAAFRGVVRQMFLGH
jgi:NAD(P)-dependent dehydrogenase (short-subunit alcohol dehydrogenase family)